LSCGTIVATAVTVIAQTLLGALTTAVATFILPRPRSA